MSAEETALENPRSIRRGENEDISIKLTQNCKNLNFGQKMI